MKRLPPSAATRETLHDLLAHGTEDEDPKSLLVRLGVQAMIEEALEAKVRDLLGRDYYERGVKWPPFIGQPGRGVKVESGING